MICSRQYLTISTALVNVIVWIVLDGALVRGFSAASSSSSRSLQDPLESPDIQVFDNVLTGETCSVMHQEACRLGLGHRVFSRPKKADCSSASIVEQALDSILQELGDDSEFIEYWTRQEWRSIHAHADVDEYLAKRQQGGEFRYPTKAHVLYLQVGQKVKGPTCVFPGRRSGGDLLRPVEAVDDSSSSRDDSIDVNLVTVPAVAGRLLRFNGDFLHAVPRPTDLWLVNFVQGSPEFSPEEDWGRSVILFNTWGSKPPLEVPIDDEPVGENVDTKEAKHTACNKLDEWNCVFPSADPSNDSQSEIDTRNEERVNAKIWLLGDLQRRDHQMQTAKLSAPDSIRSALEAESNVS
ncbi:MAG: hypothetical protein SGARI_005277, partial [Bacillariaceae sp.]